MTFRIIVEKGFDRGSRHKGIRFVKGIRSSCDYGSRRLSFSENIPELRIRSVALNFCHQNGSHLKPAKDKSSGISYELLRLCRPIVPQ